MSTGRVEQIVSEARAELASDLGSEPALDPRLDLTSDLTISLTPDTDSNKAAGSDEAAGASDDAFDFPIDFDSVGSDPADPGFLHSDMQKHERDRSKRAAARSQQTERSQQQAARPQRRPFPWIPVTCAVIVCALLVSIGVFAWDRWLRYDDASDIQGSWTAVGTQITIEIDESSIQVTDDVAYEYSLNTSDKTITFTFGDMSGSGVYSFSADRNTLVIDEQASVDILGDFLTFYHLDALFGLGGNDSSQSDDADETEDDEASDESDDTDSSDESSLSLTLERVS